MSIENTYSNELSEILADIADAVITTDAEGKVTLLNAAGGRLTGWASEDALGLDIDQVFRVTSDDQVSSPVHTVLEDMANICLPYDAILLRKDGEVSFIEGSARRLVTNGHISGAILVFRNAIEKATMFRSELASLAARISNAFIGISLSDVDMLLDEALRELGEFLNADRSYIILVSKDESTFTITNEWDAEGVDPLTQIIPSTSLAPYWVKQILDHKHIYISSVEEMPKDAYAERVLWEKNGVQTFMAVPIVHGDIVLGAIGVDSITQVKPWSLEAIDLLYLIGDAFANALGRTDALQILTEAHEHEIKIGSAIQQTLLLSEPPPEFVEYRLAALTIPSRQIDGDFYDFLVHPNYCLDIIFGDVMGKGVPAALLSAGSKTEFLRSLSHLLAISTPGILPQPHLVVNSMHSVLTPQLMNLDSFITLSYIRFDPGARTVTLVDCGNTRLLRCAEADGAIEHLAGFNLPLGFSVSEIYEEAEYEYSAGDLFFLYSDGATEARNPSREMFGLKRLCDLISENRNLNPAQLVKKIEKTIVDFTESSALTDDFTCVVLKVVPDTKAELVSTQDELQVTSSLLDLGVIRRFVKQFCNVSDECQLNIKDFNLLDLAVTEVASNIMRHAYHGLEDQPIWVRTAIQGDALRVRLSHKGEAFTHPEKVPLPSVEGSKEGGFGLFIVSRAVDEIYQGMDEYGRQYIELAKKIYESGG